MPSVIDGAFIQAWPAAPGPGPLTSAFTRGPDIEVAGADFLDLVVRVTSIGAPTPLARVDIQLESVRNQGTPGAIYERVATYGSLVAGVYTIEVPTWQMDVSAFTPPMGRCVRIPCLGIYGALQVKAGAAVSPNNLVQILAVRRLS